MGARAIASCCHSSRTEALRACSTQSAKNFAPEFGPFSRSYKDGPSSRISGSVLFLRKQCMDPLFLISVDEVLLKDESREEFAELLNTYTNRFKPRNSAELDLVEEMVIARWCHRRYWLIEGALLDSVMQAQVADDSRKTAAPTKALKQAAKFQNSNRRSHERSLKMLLTLRESRCLKASSMEAALCPTGTAPAAAPPLPPPKAQ